MSGLYDLTKQEQRVFALVVQGRRNAQIAQELYLSVHTVESHVHRIFKKLDISSRTEAAIYAFQSGLLSKPEFNGTTDAREGKSTYYQAIR
jgi:two-component system, NarL family, response regulator LiaR